MFNFLASQHREPPDIIGPFDEEEDEFPLKSSRLEHISTQLHTTRSMNLKFPEKEVV